MLLRSASSKSLSAPDGSKEEDDRQGHSHGYVVLGVDVSRPSQQQQIVLNENCRNRKVSLSSKERSLTAKASPVHLE